MTPTTPAWTRGALALGAGLALVASTVAATGSAAAASTTDHTTAAQTYAAQTYAAQTYAAQTPDAQTSETHANSSEVIGGQQFLVGAGGRCSIGFSATSGDTGGFVTAGHCGTVGTSVESDPPGGTGVFGQSIFPGQDGAFVEVTSGWTPTNLVDRQDGTTLAITGSSPAPIGSTVCVSSSVHGWQCGTIQARGQTVSYPEGSVHDLTRTDLCTGPGDSGAPVVSGDQAQGIVVGGSGDPGSGCVTYYQELGPLLSTWGLTLTTG